MTLKRLLKRSIYFPVLVIVLAAISACSDSRQSEIENTVHTAFVDLSLGTTTFYCQTLQEPGYWAVNPDCPANAERWIKKNPNSRQVFALISKALKQGKFRITINKDSASVKITLPDRTQQNIKMIHVNPGASTKGSNTLGQSWFIDLPATNQLNSAAHKLPEVS